MEKMFENWSERNAFCDIFSKDIYKKGWGFIENHFHVIGNAI